MPDTFDSWKTTEPEPTESEPEEEPACPSCGATEAESQCLDPDCSGPCASCEGNGCMVCQAGSVSSQVASEFASVKLGVTPRDDAPHPFEAILNATPEAAVLAETFRKLDQFFPHSAPADWRKP